MRLLKILLSIAVAFILTVVTQVGGVIFLLSFFAHGWVERNLASRWSRVFGKVLVVIVFYLISTVAIVPLAAKQFGRVPLPLFETNQLKPGSIWTCLLNRHYVRPPLKDAAFVIARELNTRYPRIVVNYLDANFPFINGFPLFPHLSHSDGKKLDLSFQYNDSSTGEPTNDIPSFIGYGICEEPKPGEWDQPKICGDKGYRQYNLLREWVPQHTKNQFVFARDRTKTMINAWASQENVGKIFIEPHLKTRLQITSSKVRFHGCQAVRHDDHIHVQLK